MYTIINKTMPGCFWSSFDSVTVYLSLFSSKMAATLPTKWPPLFLQNGRHCSTNRKPRPSGSGGQVCRHLFELFSSSFCTHVPRRRARLCTPRGKERDETTSRHITRNATSTKYNEYKAKLSKKIVKTLRWHSVSRRQMQNTRTDKFQVEINASL